MEADARGAPAFARTGSTSSNKQDGMRMREYYAAHCPMTITEAWSLFSRTHTGGDRHVAEAMENWPAFMEFYAQRRFEYADAMIKEGRL